MKTETLYDVVWGNDRTSFKMAVTNRIKEGWQLQGGVSVASGVNHQTGATVDCFFQAMTAIVSTPEPLPPPKPPVAPKKK